MVKSKYPVDEWMSLADKGWSNRKIGEKYNVNGDIVRYWLKKANYKKPIWFKPELCKEDAIWIAAVLDCEGSLTFHRPWNVARKSYNIQLFARVNMVTEAIPKRLHELCGGSFKFKSYQNNANKKPQYYWNITANGMRWLLPQILPFMMVKHKQAGILLDILAKNNMSKRMDREELKRAYVKIRTLNQKGIQKTKVEWEASFAE